MSDLDALKCGDCGHHRFALFHAKRQGATRVGGHGSTGIAGEIIAICANCSAETTIKPVPSTIDVQGTLCGGWGRPTSEVTDASGLFLGSGNKKGQ